MMNYPANTYAPLPAGWAVGLTHVHRDYVRYAPCPECLAGPHNFCVTLEGKLSSFVHAKRESARLQQVHNQLKGLIR